MDGSSICVRMARFVTFHPQARLTQDLPIPSVENSFTYWVTDGVNSARVQVIIAIKDNSGPATNADSYETLEDTTLTVLGSGVQGNDHIDRDHDSIRAVLVGATARWDD